MVLIRALVVLLAVSGCSASLFGVPGGSDDDGGGDDDTTVPSDCPASCIADAARDYDESPNGAGGRWRYLGDKRDHTWTPMTPTGSGMVGEAANRIARCAAGSTAPACRGLPGALLVTSSGTSGKSDPALEYTAADARVTQFAVRVHVPLDSVTHRVRLYRNSREDVLFTASAAPGSTMEQAVVADAVPGDRFLIALEPTSGQGGTSAVHFYVIDAKQTFPSTCQMTLTFADQTITSPVFDDLCRGRFTSINGTLPTPPPLLDGPFSYQGMAAYFEPGFYLYGSQPLDAGDKTIQFWVKNDAPTATTAWAFSTLDEASAQGIGLRFTSASGLKLEAATISATSPVVMYTTQSIDFPSSDQWHFVRVVHTDGMVTFCRDGVQVMRVPFPGSTAPGLVPYLGRNGPQGATDNLLGELDDVRVFSGALPCNESP